MYWKGKNVLITGATHFVARHLTEKLVKLDSNVTTFISYSDRNYWSSLNRSPAYARDKVEVVTGSFTNTEAINDVLENADIVFHFGVLDMIPSHTSARDYLDQTIIGTFNVLSAAKKYDIQKLIHVSTAEVYGKVKDMPINEKCPLRAQYPHISSDIGAEKLAEAYYLSYNLPIAIARLFNAYGPGQSRNAIVPTIIEQGLVEAKLFLGNMRAVRDFIYVKDIVDGLIRMAETAESIGEAINLGLGQGISVGDLAERIMLLIGRDIEILFDASRIRLRNSDIKQLIADMTKANELLGWQPETSLDTGLKRTIEWFSEHARV